MDSVSIFTLFGDLVAKHSINENRCNMLQPITSTIVLPVEVVVEMLHDTDV